MTPERIVLLKRLILYAVCGGSGVVLDVALYAALVGMGVWYLWANVAGYVSGTLLSFVLNRAITFKVMDAPLRRLVTFFGVALVGFLLSTAALWLMVDVGHLDPILAKIVSLVLVLVVQFSLNNAITFRSRSAG